MQTVTWAPQGGNDSILTMVQILPGKVTERSWLEALADRVQSMVDKDDNPAEAVHQAIRTLNEAGAVTLPEADPREAGRVLVLHNLELQTVMAANNQDFPQVAMNNVTDRTGLADLAMWVEAAEMALHPS